MSILDVRMMKTTTFISTCLKSYGLRRLLCQHPWLSPSGKGSCRKLYSFVVYLYVNGSGSITSFGEERANLSAIVYL